MSYRPNPNTSLVKTYRGNPEAVTISCTVPRGGSVGVIESVSCGGNSLSCTDMDVNTRYESYGEPYLAPGSAVDGETFLQLCSQGDFRGVQEALFANPSLAYTLDVDTGATTAMVAAKRGGVDMFKALVESGADLRARDNRGMDALCRASRFGNVDVIFWLLSQPGVDPDAPDAYGLTPLHHAILGESPLTVRCLLGAGVSTQCQDANGNTPLGLAKALLEAGKHRSDVLVAILSEVGLRAGGAGASNTSRSTSPNRSPPRSAALVAAAKPPSPSSALKNGAAFIKAIREGDVGRVKALLAVEPTLVEAVEEGSEITAAMASVQSGSVEVVRALVSGGANFSTLHPRNGMDAFMIAARGGHSEVLAFMLAEGLCPNINLRDRHGNTALHHAVMGNRVGAVRVLVSAGAVVSIPNAFGVVPLTLARDVTASEEVVALLQSGNTSQVGVVTTAAPTASTPARPTPVATTLQEKKINVLCCGVPIGTRYEHVRVPVAPPAAAPNAAAAAAAAEAAYQANLTQALIAQREYMASQRAASPVQPATLPLSPTSAAYAAEARSASPSSARAPSPPPLAAPAAAPAVAAAAPVASAPAPTPAMAPARTAAASVPAPAPASAPAPAKSAPVPVPAPAKSAPVPAPAPAPAPAKSALPPSLPIPGTIAPARAGSASVTLPSTTAPTSAPSGARGTSASVSLPSSAAPSAVAPLSKGVAGGASPSSSPSKSLQSQEAGGDIGEPTAPTPSRRPSEATPARKLSTVTAVVAPPTEEEITAFSTAIASSDPKAVVQALRANPALAKTLDASLDSLPIHRAAKEGSTLVLRALQAIAPDQTTAVDKRGMTPLAVAARYNKLEALNWLLAQPEVDVNARDTHGLTALHHSVLGNTAACTKALLAAGINAGLKDNVGYTPEQLAKMRAKDKNERKRVGADVVEAFKGVKASGSP